MIRGSTPTLDLILKNKDLSAYRHFITIEQGQYVLEKEAEPIYQKPDTFLHVTLTQEETLAFDAQEAYDLTELHRVYTEGREIQDELEEEGA